MTRGFRILWIKVNVTNGKHFYLNLPISLYVFEELLDCAMDLLNLICFFVPKGQSVASSQVSVHTVRDMFRTILKLLNSLVGSEAYDLVEVEARNVKVSVKIR